jgi:hypothetical protein
VWIQRTLLVAAFTNEPPSAGSARAATQLKPSAYRPKIKWRANRHNVETRRRWPYLAGTADLARSSSVRTNGGQRTGAGMSRPRRLGSSVEMILFHLN